MAVDHPHSYVRGEMDGVVVASPLRPRTRLVYRIRLGDPTRAMINQRQHFVPQHYLRQFRIGDTQTIWITMLAPYRVIGGRGIKGQCQEDYFFGKDSFADQMLQEIESKVAPVLTIVARDLVWNEEQLKTLRLLTAQLYLRSRKGREVEKLLPRFVADKVITNAIARGELPAPQGGWSADMMDFKGVPETRVGRILSLFLESGTLTLKILTPPAGKFFITSDNPVVALNTFAADAKSLNSYVGFAQSGFLLLLPLGPEACAFFYDPNVYKVGGRRQSVVRLTASDVDLVNSLQVQSAEECLYSHDPATEPELKRLVVEFAKLRVSLSTGHRIFPGKNPGEQFLLSGHPRLKLPSRWAFCSYRRQIAKKVGERRDPLLSKMIEELERDYVTSPGDVDFQDRIARVCARIPVSE